MSDFANHEDRDMLAAEYVLGLADAAAIAEAEALIESDTSFAARVESWRSRMADLDETAKPASADERLWSRIDRSLPPTRSEHVLPARAEVEAGDLSIAARLWNSLPFWRMAGLVTAAASLAFAIALGQLVTRPAPQPILVAILMTDTSETAAVVNAYADGRTELTPLKNFEIPAGKAIEIWTLWDRAIGPRSVGLIRQIGGRIELSLSGLPQPKPGQLFEMTLEPETGSPIGRPTGPVLNKGNATQAL